MADKVNSSPVGGCFVPRRRPRDALVCDTATTAAAGQSELAPHDADHTEHGLASRLTCLSLVERPAAATVGQEIGASNRPPHESGYGAKRDRPRSLSLRQQATPYPSKAAAGKAGSSKQPPARHYSIQGQSRSPVGQSKGRMDQELVLMDVDALPEERPYGQRRNCMLVKVTAASHVEGPPRNHFLSSLRTQVRNLRHLMVYMDHVVGNHEQRAQMIDVWMAFVT